MTLAGAAFRRPRALRESSYGHRRDRSARTRPRRRQEGHQLRHAARGHGKIIATVEDPKSTAGSCTRSSSHDPALVTRILKVVNSAFYGLPGQIGSIERAIVLLGLNAIKNIAVAASLGQLFRGAKLCDGFTRQGPVDALHRRRRDGARAGQADEAARSPTRRSSPA